MATKDDYTNTILTTGVIGPFINGSASSTGVIETNGDSDWFKVSLTAGKVYEFLVDTGVPGASIGLRDEFGNDTANYHPYGPDGFFYSPTISGKYHVFANDDDEYSFRYTISVNTLQKENFIGGRTYVLNDVTRSVSVLQLSSSIELK
ncbi:hypothetical protein [Crenothrix polyspora]|uniref:Peptidase C-terminal archaeal/bacterial domain-containing protein n=1 Tax=Crenothrix polyspora TaxID=360316 RepID=A0A1R4H234_9GAMM|nr:hypothetical protein [Crenothrix polyspora]SJM89899.1 hypothetical protein CRENPOLYSF1_1260001 [Crenothrix polyspora]